MEDDKNEPEPMELFERPATPMELVEVSDEANKELLPPKSKGRYNEVYQNYQNWKQEKNATSDSERVVLTYISSMANNLNKKNEIPKPLTLWSRYSMLKSTLKIYAHVDISTYPTVTAYLNRKSEGYEPKKAKTFTEDEIREFLDGAPDIEWLDVKVKRHTGHKSTKVCEAYIEESLGYKRNAADAIVSSINCRASTSSIGIDHRNILASTATDSGEVFIAHSSDAIDGSSSKAAKESSDHRNIVASTATDSGEVSMAHSSDAIELSVPPNAKDSPVNQSQTIHSSSSKTFLAQMDKRFAFYKCENITIKFNEK